MISSAIKREGSELITTKYDWESGHLYLELIVIPYKWTFYGL